MRNFIIDEQYRFVHRQSSVTNSLLLSIPFVIEDGLPWLHHGDIIYISISLTSSTNESFNLLIRKLNALDFEDSVIGLLSSYLCNKSL